MTHDDADPDLPPPHPPGAVHVLAPSRLFTRAVRSIIMAMAAVSGISLLAMMALTCIDVLLRAAVNRPISGSQDLVSVAAIIVLAGAMPYATAARGHVSVEYFFSKFPPRMQGIVIKAVQSASIALFALLCYRGVDYGLMKLNVGEVTSTLRLPVFWLPWIFAASCGGMVLVILHDLLYPGEEIVKP